MKTTLSPETLTALIDRLTDHVIAECNAIDCEARFDAMFDETHTTPDWLSGSPSRILREMEPTSYRCGVADMTGTDDTLREIRGEYYDEKEVEAARESFVDDLRIELTEAEKALAEADLVAEEQANEDSGETVGEYQAEVARLEAEIEACERHAF